MLSAKLSFPPRTVYVCHRSCFVVHAFALDCHGTVVSGASLFFVCFFSPHTLCPDWVQVYVTRQLLTEVDHHTPSRNSVVNVDSTTSSYACYGYWRHAFFLLSTSTVRAVCSCHYLHVRNNFRFESYQHDTAFVPMTVLG